MGDRTGQVEPGACWCGESDLAACSEGYRRCVSCGTLVRFPMPAGDVARVDNEDEDLYGRTYWFDRQAELGLPDLTERSVSDLTHRCLHWLRVLLAYRSPPGRVLEIGASHGGFLALLDQVGYEATGVELSPWVARYARETFGVNMLVGPVEDQDIPRGSLQAVVALDVLEHLRDPLGTITRCSDLLSEEGVLLVQTPCVPRGLPVDRLAAEDHPFAAMLLPEHLHLFHRESVTALLHRAGLEEITFEPPVFDQTDMLLVAGRRPLARRSEAEIRETLLSSRGGRLTAALLDLGAGLDELQGGYQQADEDRRQRLAQVEELTRLLGDSEHAVAVLSETRGRLESEKTRLQGILDECLSAGRAMEETTHLLEEKARDLRQELADLQAASDDRQRQLEDERAERALLADTASDLERQVLEVRDLNEQLESQRNDARQEVSRLEAALAKAARRLEEHAAAATRHGDDHARLAARHETLRTLVDDLRNSRIYRAMVRAGRWRHLDTLALTALQEDGSREPRTNHSGVSDSERWDFPLYDPPAPRGRRRPIAVDLTAMLPGAENGGAKLVALELIQAMSRLQPGRQLVLLTTARCHDELAGLETDNVRRKRIELSNGSSSLGDPDPRYSLLFSPTTAPPFRDPRVPVVSVVHDLQFRTYPDFFPQEELWSREIAFQRAVRWSQRVVAVSEYVRRSVLESSSLPPDRVRTIYSATVQRFPRVAEAGVDETLSRYGLRRQEYLLYPANFWPHKNHGMLLTAYAQWCHRHPGSDLRLVLTGAERPDPERVRQTAAGMGLNGRVIFPGYVSESDLAALLDGSLALVFPSLYEGFGLPVLEAMARGCPVLCSNLTALPEVAGDAALYFDPRKPDDIVTAIEQLTGDPGTGEDLRSRGLRRAREFGDREQMARSYLALFDELLDDEPVLDDILHGVFADRWTGGSFVVAHAEPACSLHLELQNERSDAVTVSVTAGPVTRHATLSPHQRLDLVCRLPDRSGCLTFRVTPTFCPAERHGTDDGRRLGVRLASCRLSGATDVDLMQGLADA